MSIDELRLAFIEKKVRELLARGQRNFSMYSEEVQLVAVRIMNEEKGDEDVS